MTTCIFPRCPYTTVCEKVCAGDVYRKFLAIQMAGGLDKYDELKAKGEEPVVEFRVVMS